MEFCVNISVKSGTDAKSRLFQEESKDEKEIVDKLSIKPPSQTSLDHKQDTLYEV
jgi:hypothetical protein